jgi:hypothetical protein
MTNILRNPPSDGAGQSIYPGEEAALARGVAMLKLARGGKMISLQNNEIEAMLRKLEK